MVNDLIDTYPDTFAVIEYHYDDSYDTPWGNSRKTFYNAIWVGLPMFIYDGLEDAWPIDTYEEKFLQRQAEPTDVDIQLSAVPVDEDTYEFTAELCLEPDGAARTVRLYMVQVLDHFPFGIQHEPRNGFKQAAGTEDVNLEPGVCAFVTRQFTFDADSMSHESDIKIIAWAQDPDSSGPAEVHQAAQIAWPFADPCPWDFDGNGAVNTADLLFLLGAWGTPDGDVNDDGTTNTADLLELLGQWGACP
ncbi:MAG: hypothetical protein SYC29_12590 [Planctomycetota bacterium]|nr:hypothetical protein [Planctomycetota bacterium]